MYRGFGNEAIATVWIIILIVGAIKWLANLTIGQFIAVTAGVIVLYLFLRYVIFKK